MIRRLYVHNFRCLENFELSIAGQSSVLLIGNNGTGKTTVGCVLEILQRIARGTNRIRDLVQAKDFAWGRTKVPMRFELEVEIQSQTYTYSVAFDFPDGFKELRIFDEKFAVDGNSVYSRQNAQVNLETPGKGRADFTIDWHLVALPIIQTRLTNDPLLIFKQWLARMLVLHPMPRLMTGDSADETLEPNSDLTDFGAWWSGVLAHSPSSYRNIDQHLREVMPDLKDIKNPNVGPQSRSLLVQFISGEGSMTVPFADLSDGEKCFMVCAVALAANDAYGPLLCFWDEPDNYLALSEVGHFVMALRRAYLDHGQFIATSHNPEAIRRLSEENTVVLHRKSHLEPTLVRWLKEIDVNGDLVGALIRGDVEP